MTDIRALSPILGSARPCSYTARTRQSCARPRRVGLCRFLLLSGVFRRGWKKTRSSIFRESRSPSRHTRRAPSVNETIDSACFWYSDENRVERGRAKEKRSQGERGREGERASRTVRVAGVLLVIDPVVSRVKVFSPRDLVPANLYYVSDRVCR